MTVGYQTVLFVGEFKRRTPEPKGKSTRRVRVIGCKSRVRRGSSIQNGQSENQQGGQ